MMDQWQKRLFAFVMFWTVTTTVFAWLPLVRIIGRAEGYSWGVLGMRGAGTSGPFWLFILITAYAVSLLFTAYRGPRALFYPMLMLWHSAVNAVVFVGSFSGGTGATIQGQGLHWELPLWMLGIACTLFTVMVVAWIIVDYRSGGAPPPSTWSRTNTAKLVSSLLLLVVALALFRAGTNYNWVTAVAIATTVAHWILLVLSFEPVDRPDGRSPKGMEGRFIHLAGLLVASAMVLSNVADAASQQLRLRSVPCDSALPSRAHCYTLGVPEDRTRPGRKSISIAVAVLPASRSGATAEPLLVLLGGPGAAASHSYAEYALAHAPTNAARDVIFADQRGTGRSAPLECSHGTDDDLQTYMDAFMPLDAGQRCVAALAPSTDVTRYRTVDFVADLEELRAALGIERWNLHGSSYGTRVALQYMARHPARIRAAVLAGVVPPELVMPTSFPADADRSVAMLLADCRRDSACGSAFPELAREIDSVARRLERAPAIVNVPHPVTRAPTPVNLSRGAFGEVVRATLYTANGASTLPLSIHEAYRGDYTALASAHLQRQRTVARQGWAGLYLAATCPEDIARIDSVETFAQSHGTLLGPYRARIHLAACNGWPAPAADDTWPGETRISPPVLMIVGDQDPVTAPRWAKIALEDMENGRLIVVPFGGHGFAGLVGRECIGQLEVAFYNLPEPQSLDATCVGTVRRPPFAIGR